MWLSFFVSSSHLRYPEWKGVTSVKKAILPIVIGILLIVIFIQINPAIEPFGIFLVGLIGLGVGFLANKLVFKG